MQEATLILIKPDGLIKSLTGNILTRLSETKLEIVAAKMVRVTEALAKEHYKHLIDEPFFNELIQSLQGAIHERRKVMAMVYCGAGATTKICQIAGATNPEEADAISIRGQYGRITTKGVYENVIHASSTPEEAEREIKLWFKPDDIILDLYSAKEVVNNATSRVWA